MSSITTSLPSALPVRCQVVAALGRPQFKSPSGAARLSSSLQVPARAFRFNVPALLSQLRRECVKGVCGCCAGDDGKCQRCVDLGADLAINYRTQDFVDVVRKSRQFPNGVDVLLDMVCGTYFDKNLRVMNYDGR